MKPLRTLESMRNSMMTAPMVIVALLFGAAVATAAPPSATLVSPSGSIGTSAPTYIWNAVSTSTWYQLWVTDSAANPKVLEWYTAAQAGCAAGTGTCSITPATALANGSATWWIQTWNSTGYGPWSNGMSFTVSAGGPPGKATLLTPSGSITTNLPTYTWNAVSSSTWYQLWVTDSTANPKIVAWYTAAQAGCASGTGTCSITPATALANGAATWWIQTWSPSGYGPWSDAAAFNVSSGGGLPGKATLVAPSGTIGTNIPAYTWNAVSGATYYLLYVNDSAVNGKIQTWYTSTAAGCAAGTGTCSVTPATTLASGAAQWWIQTWNTSGYGPWSDALAFNVSTGPSYQILHSFTGNDGHGFNGDTDGANPLAPLIQGPDGLFYGTTDGGSASATGPTGTVFKMDASGTVTILHHFLILAGGDAVGPTSGLIRATDGYFYGTTWDSYGEAAHAGGAVYKISADGTYTKLHTFTGAEGAGPYAGVIQATDGNFYGTTTRGGANLKGTVFRTDASGSITTALYALTDPGGYNYFKSGLIQATDGNFYGTTYSGGTSNFGTVYKVTPAGVFTRLHSFTGTPGLDGALPLAGLIQASDGNFYGTTSQGGIYNYGTVFMMTTSGTVTVLHSFTYTDGSNPRASLIKATDGYFYGTTYAGGAKTYGTVFRMAPSGTLTTLHSFGYQTTSDGLRPTAPLIQAADGSLYGTTYNGGTQNKGVVFRLNPPPPSADETIDSTDSPDR